MFCCRHHVASATSAYVEIYPQTTEIRPSLFVKCALQNLVFYKFRYQRFCVIWHFWTWKYFRTTWVFCLSLTTVNHAVIYNFYFPLCCRVHKWVTFRKVALFIGLIGLLYLRTFLPCLQSLVLALSWAPSTWRKSVSHTNSHCLLTYLLTARRFCVIYRMSNVLK